MHYHRMNILVRLILYRMKKQRNFENAEMLSHISDHNDIGMSGKNFGPLKWYTDRNFFGDEGGAGFAKNKLFRDGFSDGPVSRFAPPKMNVWLRHTIGGNNFQRQKPTKDIETFLSRK